MKLQTEHSLKRARKLYGQCARAVTTKIGQQNQASPCEREQIIGFGTAADWIRWAGSLRTMDFSSKAERISARKMGIVESVRFNQLWTATNALFAKDAILSLTTTAATLPQSEIKRFELLYAFSKLDNRIESGCLTTLRNLLGMECKADGVLSQMDPGGTPTMWEVIDQKYSRPIDRTRGIGKIISDALNSGNIPVPNGTTLIYGARNWTVHGMLLTSFFRGSRQKYTLFMDNITLLLSAILEGAAAEFLAKV